MKCFVSIDIHNDCEIYNTIINTIPFMDGWSVCFNATMGNANWSKPIVRYFAFDLEKREFKWFRDDDQGTGEEIHIHDVAHISQLLEQINEMPQVFEDTSKVDQPPTNPCLEVPKIIDSISTNQDTQVEKDHFGQSFEKIKNSFFKKYKKNWNCHFYNDSLIGNPKPYNNNWEDISPHQYERYFKSIEHALTHGELSHIYSKLCGFYGPRAKSLKNVIYKKESKLKRKEDKSPWSTCEPMGYKTSTQIKFSKPTLTQNEVNNLNKMESDLADAITAATFMIDTAIKSKIQQDTPPSETQKSVPYEPNNVDWESQCLYNKCMYEKDEYKFFHGKT